jgi:hypothetical protein
MTTNKLTALDSALLRRDLAHARELDESIADEAYGRPLSEADGALFMALRHRLYLLRLDASRAHPEMPLDQSAR